MTTIIAGWTLSKAEIQTLDRLRDFLYRNGGDSTTDPNTSPRGDGRWVDLLEIFPRSARGTASRRVTRTLAAHGVLRACEIECRDEQVKLTPYEVQPTVIDLMAALKDSLAKRKATGQQ